MTANNVCPHCGLDFARAKEFGITTAYNGTCYTCGRTIAIVAVMYYMEEGQAEGQHVFRLSYPFMCDCGKFSSICVVICKPIDVTSEFEQIKKGDKK